MGVRKLSWSHRTQTRKVNTIRGVNQLHSIFSAIEFLEVGPHSVGGGSMILYAVQLKGNDEALAKCVNCMEIENKYFAFNQKCMDFTFYLFDFQTETHFYVCPVL